MCAYFLSSVSAASCCVDTSDKSECVICFLFVQVSPDAPFGGFFELLLLHFDG